jgi:hypothetical protein
MNLRTRIQLRALRAIAAVQAAAPVGSQYAQSARIGAVLGALVGPAVACAQGFIRGMQNMNTLMQAGVALLITIGLLGGLAMILGGLWAWYKKADGGRGGEDVSYAKIFGQIGAGGLAMALGWVGVNVVETLGGSSSDIGRSIK